MTTLYAGGCACGALRYEIRAEPAFANHCQCRDCRKRSGTGHGSWLTFAAMPDLFTVPAASLDEPERFSPTVVTWHASALPWDVLDPSLARFNKMPG